MKIVWSLIPLFLMGGIASTPVHAAEKPMTTPYQLKGVGLDQKIGAKVNLGLKFLNSKGQPVTLGQYFKKGEPVILSLVYYNCPNLCGLHLEGLKDAFRKLTLKLGKDYQAIAVSFNPKEGPADAAKKKAELIKEYGKPSGAKGWHFLTGQQDQIQELAKEVGFKYKWDAATKQFLHVSVAIVMTPKGVISRYLNGVYFDPTTLRLSLVKASNGKLGSVVDTVLLFCCHFDPTKNKYVFLAMNVQRVAGFIVVLFLICLIGGLVLIQRRKNRGVQK